MPIFEPGDKNWKWIFQTSFAVLKKSEILIIYFSISILGFSGHGDYSVCVSYLRNGISNF